MFHNDKSIYSYKKQKGFKINFKESSNDIGLIQNSGVTENKQQNFI